MLLRRRFVPSKHSKKIQTAPKPRPRGAVLSSHRPAHRSSARRRVPGGAKSLGRIGRLTQARMAPTSTMLAVVTLVTIAVLAQFASLAEAAGSMRGVEEIQTITNSLEANTKVGPIPTTTLSNGVEMPVSYCDRDAV